MPELIVTRNAELTAESLLKDGEELLRFWLLFVGSDSNIRNWVLGCRYHVPRSWLKPSGNFLVVYEEWGGDPNGIALAKRTTASVCADIFEGQPTMKKRGMLIAGRISRPKAHLWCPPGQKISKINFASYGMPEGSCGNFREGSCHAHKSYGAFQKVCLNLWKILKFLLVFTVINMVCLQNCIGKQSCSVTVAPEVFGGDPCPGSRKKLSVEAACKWRSLNRVIH